jgi:hypothetical protein
VDDLLLAHVEVFPRTVDQVGAQLVLDLLEFADRLDLVDQERRVVVRVELSTAGYFFFSM